MLLKYCPKREHFSFNGMVARTQLAAIDHNSNTERKQAVLQTGIKRGKARYKSAYTKGGKKWVVKPIKEEKSYEYVNRLLEDTVNECKSGEKQRISIAPNIPKNIAPSPAPDKETLVKKHKSRFS